MKIYSRAEAALISMVLVLGVGLSLSPSHAASFSPAPQEDLVCPPDYTFLCISEECGGQQCVCSSVISFEDVNANCGGCTIIVTVTVACDSGAASHLITHAGLCDSSRRFPIYCPFNPQVRLATYNLFCEECNIEL